MPQSASSSSTWDADAIVVGAGPAGSGTAAALAQLGHRVLLLEAGRFPRDKVCGDVLLPEVATAMTMLGTSLDELAPDAFTIEGCNFTTGSGLRVGADFIDLHGRKHLWRILPRRILDERLARYAERCGAQLRENQLLEQVDWDSTRQLNVLQVKQRGSRVTYCAPVVVGADGASSRVAASRGLAPMFGTQHRYSVALRAYTDHTASAPRFEVITDGQFERGCCWIVPVSTHRANVGVGLFDARHRPTRGELVQHLTRMMDSRISLSCTQELKGWQLPSASLRRRTVADGVLLVGDAAGFVDPFTGHGIHNALTSGLLAAHAVHDAITKADWRATSQALRGYELAWRRRFMIDFGTGRLLQHVHGNQRLLEKLVVHATCDNRWAGQLMGLVGHAGPRHHLLNPRFLWQLLRSGFGRSDALPV